MGDFLATTTVDATPNALFDYLSQVDNLPRYFARMTSATAVMGKDEVHTTARMPDGQQVEGDAWFRANTHDQRIDWGSEGPHDYHGSLQVNDASGTTEVQVRMHTSRVADGDAAVEQGLRDTLATIKDLVEKPHDAR